MSDEIEAKKPKKPKLSQCCSAPVVKTFPGVPNSGLACTACLSLTRIKR